ncbi:MAG: glycosyltransferase [Pirellulaceae bacterium]
MPLRECPYRRRILDCVTGEGCLRCDLARQIVGARDPTGCEVTEAGCERCAQLPLPSTSVPNEVVASIVWSAAATRCEQPGIAFDDQGRLWQAQQYVLPALAGGVPGTGGARRRGMTAREHLDTCGYLSPAAIPDGRTETPRYGQASGASAISRPRARVGVIGFNTASGLGYMTRDLAIHGIADRWLAVPHSRIPQLDFPATSATIEQASEVPTEKQLTAWLGELDWVVMVELSYFPGLPRLARQLGVRVALIPMWEHLSPLSRWLRFVDLLICPTRFTYETLRSWRPRFGFTWELRYLPWPVARDRFSFRLRQSCEELVFVNGRGGASARDLDGRPTGKPRKGIDLVLEAARIEPYISWIVYSQSPLRGPIPRNVQVRTTSDPAVLYQEGDICVQPSRFEGLGLQLLECQAAGLPLVTLQAPPMNEHQPYGVLHPDDWQWGYLQAAQPIPIPIVNPASLAAYARHVYGTDLRAASRSAREYIEQHRDWSRASVMLRSWLDEWL